MSRLELAEPRAGLWELVRAGCTQRLVAAILTTGDLTPRLASTKVPTVVVHGDADPSVDPANGRLMADQIPGAQFVVIPGVGHEFPERSWPLIANAVAQNAARADVGVKVP